MSNFEAILLMADTVGGVQAVDIIDYPEAEIMENNSFIRELDSLSDGEQIFTLVMPASTDGVWEEIHNGYGIN